MSNTDTCICSIDKDLNGIPGEHYHPGIKRKQIWIREPHFYYISELEAFRFFYTQMLTGDATDGVKGVKGIGPKNAEKMLRDCSSEQEMFNVVRDAYSCDEEMLMNGKCLWIWRKMNDIWNPSYLLDTYYEEGYSEGKINRSQEKNK